MSLTERCPKRTNGLSVVYGRWPPVGWYYPILIGWSKYNMTKSSNGNVFPVTGHLCGEFTDHRWIPSQRPVTLNFDVFFEMRLNKWLSNDREAGDLRRLHPHYDVTTMGLDWPPLNCGLMWPVGLSTVFRRHWWLYSLTGGKCMPLGLCEGDDETMTMPIMSTIWHINICPSAV